MRLISTLCALSIAGSATLLSGHARADNWTQFMKIGLLESDLSGGFVIHTSSIANNQTNNPAGCDQGIPAPYMARYVYYPTGSTVEHREQIRQLLVAAFLAGRTVSVWVDSSTGTCRGGSEPGAAYNYVKVYQ